MREKGETCENPKKIFSNEIFLWYSKEKQYTHKNVNDLIKKSWIVALIRDSLPKSPLDEKNVIMQIFNVYVSSIFHNSNFGLVFTNYKNNENSQKYKMCKI